MRVGSADERRRLRRPQRGDPRRGQARGAGLRLAGARHPPGDPRAAHAAGRRGRADPRQRRRHPARSAAPCSAPPTAATPSPTRRRAAARSTARQEIAAGYHELELDALIGIGGDGSLAILRRLAQQGGWRLIGIPKTIDNDLGHTERAIGFSSAVEVATEAVDRLHVTAASHSRVMVLEVMGRDAGHIALSAGIAGGADVILIPEIPYTLEAVCAKIEERRRRGRNFSIVVVAESVRGPAGETITYKDAHGQSRYGGIGALRGARDRPAHRRRDPGHGARPRPARRLADPLDRVLASAFGVYAVDLVAAGRFDRMVAWQNRQVVDVAIAEAVAQYQAVDPGDALVHTARGLGIAFGDELRGTGSHRRPRLPDRRHRRHQRPLRPDRAGRPAERRAQAAGGRLSRARSRRRAPISPGAGSSEAVFAVATPVTADRIALTNSPWDVLDRGDPPGARLASGCG